LAAAFGQPGEQVEDPRASLGPLSPGADRHRPGTQVVLDGEPLEDSPPLGHVDDAEADDAGRVFAGEVVAVQQDAPCVDASPQPPQRPGDGA
jgi:hypothetical protein